MEKTEYIRQDTVFIKDIVVTPLDPNMKAFSMGEIKAGWHIDKNEYGDDIESDDEIFIIKTFFEEKTKIVDGKKVEIVLQHQFVTDKEVFKKLQLPLSIFEDHEELKNSHRRLSDKYEMVELNFFVLCEDIEKIKKLPFFKKIAALFDAYFNGNAKSTHRVCTVQDKYY